MNLKKLIKKKLINKLLSNASFQNKKNDFFIDYNIKDLEKTDELYDNLTNDYNGIPAIIECLIKYGNKEHIFIDIIRLKLLNINNYVLEIAKYLFDNFESLIGRSLTEEEQTEGFEVTEDIENIVNIIFTNDTKDWTEDDDNWDELSNSCAIVVEK